MTRISVVKLQ